MDLSQFSLGNGRRVLLSGDGQGWLWLAAGLAALVLVLALYRYERRLVSRRTGLTLLAMRTLAALALTFALFNPIALVSYREVVKGRVVLGVDLSESMATVDPGRSAEQLERLRQTLNLSPADRLETLSRREIERRLLQGDWIKSIASAHEVEAVGFAREGVPGTPETLAKLLNQDDPARLSTDWDPVLERALNTNDAAPVVGVVLLTDGLRNAQGDPGPLIDKLAARGVPVYSVLIGSTQGPRDVAVATIQGPDGVYKGDTASIEVTLKLDAPAGTEVPVTLERPTASPLRQTVQAPADGSRPVVRFPVPLDEVGPQPLTVAVGPIPGDVRPDNDRRTITVQVADDKAHVLLIDGEARWEFRYLRNALVRDPRVAVESVIFQQPASSASSDSVYLSTLPLKSEISSDPLWIYDAIILGDVSPDDLPAEVWARLDAYVAERGGALIFSPGPRHWASMFGAEAARVLLPVLDPKPVAVDPDAHDPGHPNLPPGVPLLPGQAASEDAWPMLQFDNDADRSRAVWQGLPRLPWTLAGTPKPAATLLARAANVDDQGGVIAAMPYGLGKVLWVGTDATWRWRFRVGDLYHHRFWGQTVRWAASGRLAAGNRLVRFGPEKSRVAEGDGVAIQARFAEEAPGVGPDLLVAARVFKAATSPKPGDSTTEGDAVAVVPLRPETGQIRAFAGTIPGLPPGPYVVRLDVPQLAEPLRAEGPAPEAALEVAPRDTSERIELAARRDPLDRLASATGGAVFPDDQAGSLTKLLRKRTLETVRYEETPLWDRPLALVFFFTVLTIEWVMRKRAGLP